MSRLSLLTVINGDGHATLTLNRPDQDNRLDAALMERITETLQRLDAGDQVRVVSLRANGPDFCGGWGRQLRLADQSSDADSPGAAGSEADHATDEPVDPRILDIDAFTRMIETMRNIGKPILAELHGSNLGPALALAAGCDCVLAAETARFRLADHDERTLCPAVLETVAGAIGMHQVRRYLLTAESMSAMHAQSLGLVHEVLPSHGLERGGREMVQRLLAADTHWQAKARQHLTGLGSR